jgi:hypothetical protein
MARQATAWRAAVSVAAAAAVLGRKGGAAGKGSPARKAAAQHAIRTRWDRAKAAK